MLFSSLTFLFAFLPCVIIGYYLISKKNIKHRNIFLTICSLLFYAWGEPVYVFLMMSSIVINWLLANIISNSSNREKSKLFLYIAISINMGILFLFKYLDFMLININFIFNKHFVLSGFILPIGISFFTFQALSYVIDVYRDKTMVQKSIINVGLYISLFPQLIAGPIVRYHDVSKQIVNRTHSLSKFSEGVHRFTLGLIKKVLIANNVAQLADYVFDTYIHMSNPSSAILWIGALAYTLQIYFDFSGYSDMAIGLGKMLGFTFLENFNYPYKSKSVSEFWQRWHISLGNWFKDYVYFPLGGSRVSSKKRLVFNLSVVWLFTGLWHGANWTFIVWGMFHGLVVVIEKLKKSKKEKNIFFSWFLTMLFVIIGWCIFRSEDLTVALKYIVGLFRFNTGEIPPKLNYLLKTKMLYIIFGILFSVGLKEKIHYIVYKSKTFNILYSIIVFILFLVVISSLIKNSYNPFIYFNF